MSMRRKISYALILTALVCVLPPVVIVACDRQAHTPSSSAESFSETEHITLIKQDKTTIPLTVEMALTPAQQMRGLMGRETMHEQHGMLFVFPQNRIRNFWMKNTPLFLDIIFIDDQGAIAHIHHRARPFDETLISSQIPVRAVLEINGGLAQKWGLAVGDRITPIFW